MSFTILPKRKANTIPTPADLQVGELFLDTTKLDLYTKKDDNTIGKIGGNMATSVEFIEGMVGFDLLGLDSWKIAGVVDWGTSLGGTVTVEPSDLFEVTNVNNSFAGYTPRNGTSVDIKFKANADLMSNHLQGLMPTITLIATNLEGIVTRTLYRLNPYNIANDNFSTSNVTIKLTDDFDALSTPTKCIAFAKKAGVRKVSIVVPTADFKDTNLELVDYGTLEEITIITTVECTVTVPDNKIFIQVTGGNFNIKGAKITLLGKGYSVGYVGNRDSVVTLSNNFDITGDFNRVILSAGGVINVLSPEIMTTSTNMTSAFTTYNSTDAIINIVTLKFTFNRLLDNSAICIAQTGKININSISVDIKDITIQKIAVLYCTEGDIDCNNLKMLSVYNSSYHLILAGENSKFDLNSVTFNGDVTSPRFIEVGKNSKFDLNSVTFNGDVTTSRFIHVGENSKFDLNSVTFNGDVTCVEFIHGFSDIYIGELDFKKKLTCINHFIVTSRVLVTISKVQFNDDVICSSEFIIVYTSGKVDLEFVMRYKKLKCTTFVYGTGNGNVNYHEIDLSVTGDRITGTDYFARCDMVSNSGLIVTIPQASISSFTDIYKGFVNITLGKVGTKDQTINNKINQIETSTSSDNCGSLLRMSKYACTTGRSE